MDAVEYFEALFASYEVERMSDEASEAMREREADGK
jgi:hypothetical protein